MSTPTNIYTSCNGLDRGPSRTTWLPAWTNAPSSKPVEVIPELPVDIAPEPSLDITKGDATEPLVVEEPALICRCGSKRFRDFTIHDGQSIRRDCALCRRFVAFIRWYGVTR